MEKKKILYGCYYTYLVIGAISLIIGAILPSLLEKCSLSYANGGILLSAHSIGFLICSTLTGLIAEYIGKKRTVIIISALLPVALLGLAYTTNPILLFIFLLMTGFARGAVNNTNNSTVSVLANGEAGPVNVLHSFFAIGGCLAPFIVSMCTQFGIGFETALIVFAALAAISVIVFAKLDIDSVKPPVKKKRADASFLKSVDFYVLIGIMFFYLCSETSINGWLTTYLKDTGAMSPAFAPLMVSLMWLVMIGGRLINAKISKKMPIQYMLVALAGGACAVYGIFTLTHNAVLIPVLILLIGLFLSGIYPTSVSGVNRAVDFSAFGMGIAMGSAGLGSIVMPSVIGFVAEEMGITAGMVCIFVSMALMLVCAVVYMARNAKRENK